jgi:hypothetical protein
MALRQTCFGKSAWGGPLVGSYPNWFIAELRYPETIDGNPCHARFTTHAKIIGALPTTRQRDTDPSIRFQISEQCILPSARPVCRQERRACDPKQRDRLPTPRKDSSESAPIGRCLCFKPVSASCFQIADSRLLHRQGALLRCPRISTAITPELNASDICRVEHSAFDYLVISMMKNTPPAIAQARIAQAKRAKLRANQREACA